MGAGAIFISPIADVMGRRAVVILSTVIMSLGMFASAATSNVLELWLCRFATGLGIGGVLASGNTLLAEYAPDPLARFRHLDDGHRLSGRRDHRRIGLRFPRLAEYGWRSAFVFGGLASTVLLPLSFSICPNRSTSSCRAGAQNALAQVNRGASPSRADRS